jgi:predicted PurR-regulated permease PerM
VLEGAVLIGAILYFAERIIIPLALAVLLTFILSPIVSRIQRAGATRVPAVLMVAALVFLLLAGIGWGVSTQIEKLAIDLPRQTKQIGAKLAPLRAAGQKLLDRLHSFTHEVSGPGTPEQSVNPDQTTESSPPPDEKQVVVVRPEQPSVFDLLARVLGPVLEPLAMAGLVIVLVIFMLITREDLRNRLIGLLGMAQLPGTTKVFEDAANRLSRFLLAQLALNSAFGLLIGIGVFFLGVPYALVWGLLATILRFIPYLGVWLAAAFPVLLSLALAPGWSQPIWVISIFVVLDVIAANVIEPLLFGHSTGVAPVALLVAAAFWTWIWGPIGLVLSTPLTVGLVVLGRHVPPLRFLAVLLSDQPALPPSLRYYQRMLARDRTEAQQVAEQYARDHGLAHAYDEVLLPALVQARRDRGRDELTSDQEASFYELTRQVINDLAAARRPEKNETPKASNGQVNNQSAKDPGKPDLSALLVLACPARHKSEELALEMLRHLLEPKGCRVEVISTQMMPCEAMARAEQQHAALVYVAVLPPSRLTKARYLAKKFRRQSADRPIVVGYCGNRRHFDKILMRLRSAGASYVTTSLLQSRSQIVSSLKQIASIRAASPQAAAW